ncbi:uncharacterized protein B0H64DRAFT_133459 [Chaetomium fimeti]|uniref:Uncharacterized protein n=1 Tax=Chaetomium fimeti TaxID=1854472 RepID=A0AAE0HJS3_9PEZI|nr:hypothetical protein B0H64DRAFT_133459 [Chaetomium fimeti]
MDFSGAAEVAASMTEGELTTSGILMLLLSMEKGAAGFFPGDRAVLGSQLPNSRVLSTSSSETPRSIKLKALHKWVTTRSSILHFQSVSGHGSEQTPPGDRSVMSDIDRNSGEVHWRHARFVGTEQARTFPRAPSLPLEISKETVLFGLVSRAVARRGRVGIPDRLSAERIVERCSNIDLFHGVELKGRVPERRVKHSIWLLFCRIPNTPAGRINCPISGDRMCIATQGAFYRTTTHTQIAGLAMASRSFDFFPRTPGSVRDTSYKYVDGNDGVQISRPTRNASEPARDHHQRSGVQTVPVILIEGDLASNYDINMAELR